MTKHPAPSPGELSRIQGQALMYMRAFLQANHQLPPCNQIAKDFGWASPNSGHAVVRALEKKGYLQRNELGNHMLSDQGMRWVPSAIQKGDRP
ncbi:MAG: hypothetical protein K2X51_12645 [Burkholderiales bacterium]|nr:hypothetical protein [Burkholderiales bacterium]